MQTTTCDICGKSEASTGAPRTIYEREMIVADSLRQQASAGKATERTLLVRGDVCEDCAGSLVAGSMSAKDATVKARTGLNAPPQPVPAAAAVAASTTPSVSNAAVGPVVQ